MKIKDTISFLNNKMGDLYPGEETRNIAFLVLEYLGFTKRDILLAGDAEFDPKLIQKLEDIANELSLQKPVQYVLGQAEFYGLKFKVDEYVLIPRSETEELVDLIIKENPITNPRIVDIGTGSGCIAVCLAKFIKGSEVLATDISAESIKMAVVNAERNNVSINFLVDDIINTALGCQSVFDILVSNPPYVTESEKKWMHRNVLDHEPGSALFVPDHDPLKYFLKIAGVGMCVLKEGARFYAEINEKFGREVMEVLTKQGYKNVEIVRDINGKDRIVKAIKPKILL